MKLIILSGGLGTRLQSISNGIPKALMLVGDSVFLDFLLEQIFKYNISHVYLSLHYKQELFNEYIENCIYKDRITSIVEPEPLGTGGAVNYVIDNSPISSPFFVINGDSLSNISLDQMFKEFQSRNLTVMVGISRVKDATRYGAVLEQKGKILSFEEKSVRGAGWINNGYYIFKKEAFDGYNGTFSLEKDLFPNLVQNQELGAFKVADDNFIDMGVPDDYKKLCNIYDEVK